MADRAVRGPGSADDPEDDVDVSVVVPTYRGQSSLPELVEQLHEVLSRSVNEYEVIVVNDASPDDTWETLCSLASRFPRLRALELRTNGGQAQATLCGLANARGEVIVTMDDDLQHPPSSLPVLLRELANRPDLDAVVGAWPRDQGFFRSLGTRLHTSVNRIAYGSPRGFRHTAFRAIRKDTVQGMLRRSPNTPVVSSLLWNTTRRIENVAVDHDERQHGASTFRFADGVRMVTRNLLQASTLPLRALSIFGVAASTLAFLVSLIYLARWMAGAQPPPGWTSSFLVAAFFGGATLFGIGLVGEYVGLLLKEIRGRQGWDVRRELVGEPSDRGQTATPGDESATRSAPPQQAPSRTSAHGA